MMPLLDCLYHRHLLVNPGFETGSTDPWKVFISSNNYVLSLPDTGGHNCPHYHRGDVIGDGSSVFSELTQDIIVPDGFSNIEISAWVRGYDYRDDPKSIIFVLALDKAGCTYLDTKDLFGWNQVKCPRVAATTGKHELLIQVVGYVTSAGTSGSFSIDDIAVVPIEEIAP
jgi:hypothetical protein